MQAKTPLPIDAFLDEVTSTLERHPNLVLVAEAGAGKTTRLPPALLKSNFIGDQKILVLQPRRVAARTTAKRIADEWGCTLGQEIGYRIRFDHRSSAQTRLEILTEGLLLRQLQTDPMLDGIGCVVLDEFHERSLNTDLGLALLKEVQESVRSDLRIVVMSATLNPKPVAQWLNAEIMTVPGRTFPIEIVHAQQTHSGPLGKKLTQRMASSIRMALKQSNEGDVLAFLPGVGEIENLKDRLSDLEDVDVLPLHGRLPAKEQDRAFGQSKRRKVILATNIAETSVTIPGIQVVVDSGLARQPKFDSGIGLERLELVRISQQSAAQRAGRAGRTQAGLCYRLWTAQETRLMPNETPPEIQRADLLSTALQLHVWGTDPALFNWYQAPTIGVIRAAQEVLTQLDALKDGRVTPIGHQLAKLPVSPRIGRVLISAQGSDDSRVVATVASLISEKDIFHSPPDISDTSDLELRLDALQRYEKGQQVRGLSPSATRHLMKVRDDLLRIAGDANSSSFTGDWIPHLLRGFPDRVAQRRAEGSERFLLANGQGARLSDRSVVKAAKYVIAVGLMGAQRGQRQEHQITLAHGIETSDLRCVEMTATYWDDARGRVRAVLRQTYGQLILREVDAREQSLPLRSSAELLAQAVSLEPMRHFKQSISKPLGQFVARIRWLSQVRPELSLPSVEWLRPSDTAHDELIEFCLGYTSLSEYASLNPINYIQGHLGYEGSQLIETLAPSELELPDGSRKKIRYEEGKAPVLSTRFERLFGLSQTPQVAGTQLMLELLAPNMRPIQTTQDLASFWANTYPMVRKELRGRYPKHPWPEDPLTCPPGIHRRRKDS